VPGTKRDEICCGFAKAAFNGTKLTIAATLERCKNSRLLSNPSLLSVIRF
jgi:hypothetical protein